MPTLETLLTAYDDARSAASAAKEALVTELLENPRDCEHCGDTLTRHQFETGTESLTAFVKRRYCSTSCSNASWSIEEEAILRKEYPRGGSRRVRISLAHAGFGRTGKGIRDHALRLGITYDRAPAKPAPKPPPKTVSERALAVIRDFRGLPLTYDDISELAGTSRDNAMTVATNLVRDGLVERYRFEGQTLLRALEWEKAA